MEQESEDQLLGYVLRGPDPFLMYAGDPQLRDPSAHVSTEQLFELIKSGELSLDSLLTVEEWIKYLLPLTRQNDAEGKEAFEKYAFEGGWDHKVTMYHAVTTSRDEPKETYLLGSGLLPIPSLGKMALAMGIISSIDKQGLHLHKDSLAGYPAYDPKRNYIQTVEFNFFGVPKAELGDTDKGLGRLVFRPDNQHLISPVVLQSYVRDGAREDVVGSVFLGSKTKLSYLKGVRN